MRKNKEVPLPKKEISQIIRLLLSDGWSQDMIAESLGVSAATISLLKLEKYDSGLSSLDKHLLSLKKLISDANISEADIYRDDEKKSKKIKEETTFADWLAEQIEKFQISPATLAEEAKLSALTINYILDGTTSNPQAGTRNKIEKAIDKLSGKEVKKAPDAAKSIVRQIFSGLPFNDQEINQVPNKKGVYTIHDRRGHPTYIGKGDIRARLKSHKEHRAFVDDRVAYSFSYVILQEGDDSSSKKEADQQSLWLENLITKFAGNTVLLNKKLITDLSDSEEAQV